MKNTKIIICLILSITIGIAAATPLIRAELSVKPWVTRVQGPTAPFNIEVVYVNFTITDPDAPITQTSGPTIDYYAVINVTNPSEYKAILSSMWFNAAQKIQSTTSQTPLIDLMNFTSEGGGGEAKGAWVDGVYYNVTLTIPYPRFDSNGIITESQSDLTEEELYTYYYQWIEGVQYFKHTVKEETSINTYTYLNIDGAWVDVTGRVTIDQTESRCGQSYMSVGMITNHQSENYLGSGSKASKDNEYDCFFAPGESRLLVISGSLDHWAFLGDINPVDVIQSGIIQTLAQAQSFVDMDPYGENNTFIETSVTTAEIQTLSLTRNGNSYIYNAVLSENQMFELDRYGLEVFIVPVR